MSYKNLQRVATDRYAEPDHDYNPEWCFSECGSGSEGGVVLRRRSSCPQQCLDLQSHQLRVRDTGSLLHPPGSHLRLLSPPLLASKAATEQGGWTGEFLICWVIFKLIQTLTTKTDLWGVLTTITCSLCLFWFFDYIKKDIDKFKS